MSKEQEEKILEKIWDKLNLNGDSKECLKFIEETIKDEWLESKLKEAEEQK